MQAKRYLLAGCIAWSVAVLLGCRTPSHHKTVPRATVSSRQKLLATEFLDQDELVTSSQPVVVAASAFTVSQPETTKGDGIAKLTPRFDDPDSKKLSSTNRPAYSLVEELPIDLPTVLQLIDRESPTILISRAKIAESKARYDRSKLQWIPNLSIGLAYNRFDGQTQNQRGDVFGVSRSNIFASGGPSLSLDTAEAYYAPLIERRLHAAEQSRSQAIVTRTELEGVIAYFDLVQLHALKAINTETLQRSEEVLKAATDVKQARPDRSTSDVNRSKMDVLSRKAERSELEAKILAASARLANLISVQPCVRLLPAEQTVVPVEIIAPDYTLDDLIHIALCERRDLESNRQLLAAAWERVKRHKQGKYFPKITVSDQAGMFGGGINSTVAEFDSRNVLGAQVYWEVKNLGLGNQTEIDERRQIAEQARLNVIEAQAKAIAELVELAQTMSAKYETMELTSTAVEESEELCRIGKKAIESALDPNSQFDASRTLQAIQLCNQLKQNYLSTLIEFNKSQYRLYTLLGRPSRIAVENHDDFENTADNCSR